MPVKGFAQHNHKAHKAAIINFLLIITQVQVRNENVQAVKDPDRGAKPSITGAAVCVQVQGGGWKSLPPTHRQGLPGTQSQQVLLDLVLVHLRIRRVLIVVGHQGLIKAKTAPQKNCISYLHNKYDLGVHAHPETHPCTECRLGHVGPSEILTHFQFKRRKWLGF